MSKASGLNQVMFKKNISPIDDDDPPPRGIHKKSSVRDNPDDETSSECDIKTIQQSSKIIFIVSKFFGFSLFKLPGINLKNHKVCRKFKITTTLVDVTVFCAVLSVYIYLIYYNAWQHFDPETSNSLILTVGGQVCLIIGLIISTAAIILSYLRRESVFKIFLNLCYIDIELETYYNDLVLVPLHKKMIKNIKTLRTDKLPLLIDHYYHFKFSIWFLVMGLLFICFDISTTYLIIKQNFRSNPLLYISYALQNTSFLMITMQTVLFLLVIKTRYAALNKLICCYLTIQDDANAPELEELYDLEKYSESPLPGFTSATSLYKRNWCRFDRKIIAEFAQMHDKLNDIVESINCCYSIQCLGVVAVSFGYVILTFFSLYYALYHPDVKTTKLASVYGAWFIFYVVSVLALIVSSCQATNEGNKTGVLLHKSINQIQISEQMPLEQIADIVDSLRTFSLQLQKRSPIVSCGLFTYDWILLYAIISASSTYLIILIQFDSSMSPTSSSDKLLNTSINY